MENGIFTHMNGWVFMVFMQVNIPVPWILWVRHLGTLGHSGTQKKYPQKKNTTQLDSQLEIQV